MKGEEFINKIIQGDVLEVLRRMPDEFVDCIITSPPYWSLRDYGIEGQIGLEPTLDEWLEKLLVITAELKRVLKPTGVMFWNHGDNYATGSAGSNWAQVSQEYLERTGNKPTGNARMGIWHRKYEKPVPLKSLCLQNYRLILRMIDEQKWILRNIIIWNKPNHMPSSVTDRFANSYEPVFFLVKSQKYWFDLDSVRVPQKEFIVEKPGPRNVKYAEGDKLAYASAFNELRAIKGISYNPLGKNPGDVWTIPTQPFPEAHFATFPEKLIEPMIKAGCPQWICKKCGKARERIVEREHPGANPRSERQEADPHVAPSYPPARPIFAKTLGWTDCGCNAGWRPGIVLDPFIGSGTTAVVARRLGRWYIGIELNPDYIKIAEKRLAQLQLF